MLDNMYTVQEVARALSVSTRTIHRFIRGEGGRAKLPAQKIGNSWRITERALKEYTGRAAN